MGYSTPPSYVNGTVLNAAAFNLYFRDNLGYFRGAGSGAGSDITLDSIVLAASYELTADPAQLVKALSGTKAEFRALAESSAIATNQTATVIGAAGETETETRDIIGGIGATRTGSGAGTLFLRRSQTGEGLVSGGAVSVTAANDVGINKTPTSNLDATIIKAAEFRQGGSLLGQWTSTTVGLPRFVGSGLNDITTSIAAASTFTGPALRTYIVEVESTGTPDKVRWSGDGGISWTTGASMVASPTLLSLSHNVRVTWAASTGHTLGERWEFTVTPDGLKRYTGNGRVTGQLQATANTCTTPVFDGDGPNDFSASILGTYTGVDGAEYVVEIDGASATDTFAWSRDGGRTWAGTAVTITGVAQTLEHGVRVTFGATTGHEEGDTWTWNVFRAGLVVDSTTTVTNLNSGKLLGYGWPDDTLETVATTPVTAGFGVGTNAKTLVATTADRDGWYLVLAEATGTISADDAGQSSFALLLLELREGSSYVGFAAEADCRTAGDQVRLTQAFLVERGAGQAITAVLLGSVSDPFLPYATSTFIGSVCAVWLAPPMAHSGTAFALTITLQGGGALV